MLNLHLRSGDAWIQLGVFGFGWEEFAWVPCKKQGTEGLSSERLQSVQM